VQAGADSLFAAFFASNASLEAEIPQLDAGVFHLTLGDALEYGFEEHVGIAAFARAAADPQNSGLKGRCFVSWHYESAR
jgi:hypothetical protein